MEDAKRKKVPKPIDITQTRTSQLDSNVIEENDSKEKNWANENILNIPIYIACATSIAFFSIAMINIAKAIKDPTATNIGVAVFGLVTFSISVCSIVFAYINKNVQEEKTASIKSQISQISDEVSSLRELLTTSLKSNDSFFNQTNDLKSQAASNVKSDIGSKNNEPSTQLSNTKAEIAIKQDKVR